MIRLLRTSAGEQTVVATVPCHIHFISILFRDRKGTNQGTYSCETSSKVAENVVLKVGCLQKFRLEEVVPGDQVRDKIRLEAGWAHEAS